MTTYWLLGEVDESGVLHTVPSFVTCTYPTISIKDDAKDTKT